jgi:hypothetical protein
MKEIHNLWIRTGVLLMAVILACTATSAGRAVAAPLGQAGTGTITGQVLSLDDVPLPNVKLAAFAQAPGTPDRIKLADVQSDAQGRYSVQVPAGQIWMEFLTQDIAGQSFWGYDNLPVNLASGQTIGDQNFRVAIRIVSEPTAPVSTPVPSVPASPPGMPTTGAGTGMLLPAIMLGVMLLLLGLVQRRRAPR